MLHFNSLIEEAILVIEEMSLKLHAGEHKGLGYF